MQTPRLRAVGLSKRFGDGVSAILAVDGVNLSLAPGELVLIMGPSGSGKTTLLTMLGGILRPTSGEVHIGDMALHEMSDAALARFRRDGVGFIFQTSNLLSSLSAVENVLVALNLNGVAGRTAEDRARGLLAALGMGERAHLKPEALSAGERQRVSVARALANRPAFLLADEPTANLDRRRGLDVMQILRSEADGGRSVVVVSHDDRLRDLADRTLRLEEGRLSEAP